MEEIKQLSKIIKDESRIIYGEKIEKKFLSDTLGRKQGKASALVFVKSTQEVSEVLKFANKNKIPVTPRGAGTNLVGSTVPFEDAIIIDFSQMNRILEIDRENFTATVEPGVILQDFQKYVESLGLFYPPDPGDKESSIGGNISTNAGGMRAVKYGVTRDYVRGLEVVLADGTVLQAGGKCVKDASGLSLKNLFVGSEGTLAVITKCILKLIPKPETSVSVLVPYADLEKGITSVLAILQAGADPTAVEFIQRKVVALGERYSGVQYPCPEAGSFILLTFDGHASQVQESVERVRRVALEHGAMDYIVLDDPARAADIWRVRGALVKAVEAVSEQEPVDIVVPMSKTADFIAFIHTLEQESGMQMVSFGHAGDGNLHVYLCRDALSDEAWHQTRDALFDRMYQKATELGGLVSGEHGIGYAKKPYLRRQYGDTPLSLMQGIKQVFDPQNILNPGKIF